MMCAWAVIVVNLYIYICGLYAKKIYRNPVIFDLCWNDERWTSRIRRTVFNDNGMEMVYCLHEMRRARLLFMLIRHAMILGTFFHVGERAGGGGMICGR